MAELQPRQDCRERWTVMSNSRSERDREYAMNVTINGCMEVARVQNAPFSERLIIAATMRAHPFHPFHPSMHSHHHIIRSLDACYLNATHSRFLISGLKLSIGTMVHHTARNSTIRSTLTLHALTLADLSRETGLDGGYGSSGSAGVASNEVETVLSFVQLGIG